MSLTNMPIVAKVFFDKQHQGTRAAIFLAADNFIEQQMLTLAKSSGCEASVFLSNNNSTTHARIFNSEAEIQWCGHGLLAAAHVLNLTQNVNQIQLPAGTIDIEEDKTNLWLGFEPLIIQQGFADDISQESLLQAFDSKPIEQGFVGYEDGYLILEWPQEFDLSQLKVDFSKLKKASQRAVIATQKANDGYDFKLRYFAPHHGANEDPATGSANRVLASYWAAKSNKSTFIAEQLSTRGAVILSKIAKNKVWISGRVELIKEPN